MTGRVYSFSEVTHSRQGTAIHSKFHLRYLWCQSGLTMGSFIEDQIRPIRETVVLTMRSVACRAASTRR